MDTSSRQRMVHVLGSLDVGGAELRLLDMCAALGDRDPQQVFLTLAGRRGAIASRFEDSGGIVEQCSLHPVPTFPFRLYSMLRRLNPDVVVSHVSLVSGLILTVARIAGIPGRVAWIRSSGDGRESTVSRRLMRRLLRKMLRSSATTILAVSKSAMEFAIEDANAWTGRTAVLPNGVDTTRFHILDKYSCRRALDLSRSSVVVVHIGRASPEKNRSFLLAIDAAMRSVDHTIVVAGPGGIGDIFPLNGDEQRRHTMRFIGSIDDIPTLLCAADVLVLPSTREGLPGVILEALSCGVPVVANDLPTLRELAAALPGIQSVDIGLGSEAWADAIVRAAAIPMPDRRALRESIRSSKYTLDRALGSWRSTW